MGSVLLPIPLSPACGLHEEALCAWVPAPSGGRAICPALAPVSGSVGRFGFDPRIISFPPGGSETVNIVWPVFSSGSASFAPCGLKPCIPIEDRPTFAVYPTLRLRGFNGPVILPSEDDVLSDPRPRSSSPSRRYGSEFPLSAPAFRLSFVGGTIPVSMI